MNSLLDGVKVLDLTRMFAGPCCSETLADLGATVLKIEEPRVGDPTRRNLPSWGDESAYFMALNRGKQSVALDLKTPDGLKVFERLVQDADVVVENFRPGVMDRLGLSFDRLCELRKDIVVCSISGFGATGPLRDKISFDLVNQAMSGIIDVTGMPGHRPVRIGVPVGDMAAGLYATVAISAGLANRRRTGEAVWIDLALHDVLIGMLVYMAQLYFITGTSPTRVGTGHHNIAPYRSFQASDGWLVVGAFTDEFWHRLATTLGLESLLSDQRFTSVADRKRNEKELDAFLEPILATKTVGEWLRILDESDVPAAPVQAIDQALESTIVQQRGIIYNALHPTVGDVSLIGSPIIVDGERAGTGSLPPVHGSATESILTEIGYTKDEIASLTQNGSIKTR